MRIERKLLNCYSLIVVVSSKCLIQMKWFRNKMEKKKLDFQCLLFHVYLETHHDNEKYLMNTKLWNHELDLKRFNIELN